MAEDPLKAWIGSLPPKQDKGQLWCAVHAAGVTTCVEAFAKTNATDPEHGDSWGFLAFQSVEDRNAAILALNGTMLLGKVVHVTAAHYPRGYSRILSSVDRPDLVLVP